MWADLKGHHSGIESYIEVHEGKVGLHWMTIETCSLTKKGIRCMHPGVGGHFTM